MCDSFPSEQHHIVAAFIHFASQPLDKLSERDHTITVYIESVEKFVELAFCHRVVFLLKQPLDLASLQRAVIVKVELLEEFDEVEDRVHAFFVEFYSESLKHIFRLHLLGIR